MEFIQENLIMFIIVGVIVIIAIGSSVYQYIKGSDSDIKGNSSKSGTDTGQPSLANVAKNTSDYEARVKAVERPSEKTPMTNQGLETIGLVVAICLLAALFVVFPAAFMARSGRVPLLGITGVILGVYPLIFRFKKWGLIPAGLSLLCIAGAIITNKQNQDLLVNLRAKYNKISIIDYYSNRRLYNRLDSMPQFANTDKFVRYDREKEEFVLGDYYEKYSYSKKDDNVAFIIVYSEATTNYAGTVTARNARTGKITSKKDLTYECRDYWIIETTNWTCIKWDIMCSPKPNNANDASTTLNPSEFYTEAKILFNQRETWYWDHFLYKWLFKWLEYRPARRAESTQR